MHKLVERGRVNFGTLPAIELSAKLTQGLTQVAVMRNSRPFPNEAFDPLRDFLHLSIGVFG
jgi:hypothetical protein